MPLIFGVAAILYLLVLHWIVRPRLYRETGYIVLALAAAGVFLIGPHASGGLAQVRFWRWFLDAIDGEKNLVATFASMQLMAVGLAAFAAGGWAAWNNRQRAYWLLLGAVFVFMAADEYFMLHEGFYNWEYLYAGVGGLLVLSGAVVYWLDLRTQGFVFLLVMVGLAMMAAGGIVLEDVVVKAECFQLVTPFAECRRIQVFEEFFELAGANLILAGVLHFVHSSVDTARVKILWRRGAVVLMIWLVVLLGNFWVQPAIEAQWLADSSPVFYVDGALELVGYQVSERPITRDTGHWQATLYWRANAPLPAEYGVSLHFLTYPEVASITQNDVLLLNPPHPDWLPGQVIKQVIDLDIPPDMDVPRNYWLTVTLWQRPWTEHHTIPISATEERLLTPEIVILEDFPAG